MTKDWNDTNQKKWKQEPQAEQIESLDDESISQEELQQIMAKYDRESAYRRPKGFWKWAIIVISVYFSSFQIYTSMFVQLQAQQHRATFLLFIAVLYY